MDKTKITEEERCLGGIAMAIEEIEDGLGASFRGFDRLWEDRNTVKAIWLIAELAEISKHVTIACDYLQILKKIYIQTDGDK